MSRASPAVKLWYLPPSVQEPAFERDGGIARLASVTPELVREAVRSLDAAALALAQLPIETIIAAVDRAIRCWQAPSEPERLALLEHGPALSGYSAGALRYAIDVMLPKFSAEGLRRLLTEELGEPAALDRLVPIGSAMRMARGPGRQYHVFAGGVPSVPIFSLICGLLLKGPVLAKPSASEPLFPALFARTLARVEPRLAEALAVLPWRGGEPEIEAEALVGAGAVVAYGSDETIAGIRPRTPGSVGFVGYGHSLSCAAVARESLTEAGSRKVARRLAWDVALFDQRGCLSPQFAAVENGGEMTPVQLAEQLAGELEVLRTELPRGSVTPSESARIQTQRELAQFWSASDLGVRIWQSAASTDWTVICRDKLTPSSGRNRYITLVAVDDLATGLHRLCSGLPVSTIGLAAPPQRLYELAPTLAPLASRLCPLGAMGEPPITWRHDGRKNLEPLVTWVDHETC